MRYPVAALLGLLCLLMPAQAIAESRWVGIEELEEELGQEVRDVTGPRGYWAGKVREAELVFRDDGSVKTTGRIKVLITWVTDRTDYQCHSVYIMNLDEVEDFTHRSLALRRCR